MLVMGNGEAFLGSHLGCHVGEQKSGLELTWEIPEEMAMVGGGRMNGTG